MTLLNIARRSKSFLALSPSSTLSVRLKWAPHFGSNGQISVLILLNRICSQSRQIFVFCSSESGCPFRPKVSVYLKHSARPNRLWLFSQILSRMWIRHMWLTVIRIMWPSWYFPPSRVFWTGSLLDRCRLPALAIAELANFKLLS